MKEGQVLFLIDPAPLQASFSASQAQLASAQASYTNAHVAAHRARQLIAQKFVSRSDLDNAEAAERSAAAAVQSAQAGVTSSRINLDYASVRAPISGRAGKQQVTEGALVGQGDVTLLTTVDQLDPLYVNFSMSVSELEALRKAQRAGGVSLQGNGQAQVQVALGDGSVYGETGTLDFSGAVVDPQTGAVSLRAQLPNPDKFLMPGSFVTLQGDAGRTKQRVPDPAIGVAARHAGRVRDGRGQGRQRAAQERHHLGHPGRQMAGHRRPGCRRFGDRRRRAESEGRRACQGHAMEARCAAPQARQAPRRRRCAGTRNRQPPRRLPPSRRPNSPKRSRTDRGARPCPSSSSTTPSSPGWWRS